MTAPDINPINKKKAIDDLALETKKAKEARDRMVIESTKKDIEYALKNYRINQVVMHAKEFKDKGKLTFASDLDTRLFVYLLEYLNNKNTKDKDGKEDEEGLKKIYADDAVFLIISKGGTLKDLETTKDEDGHPMYPTRDGLTIVADVSNTWLEYEEDGKNKKVTFDHHGEGKRAPTCVAKDLYEIMKDGELLTENPEWLQDFVKFVNELDNLSFVDEKNDKGEKILTEEYFLNEFPLSLRGISQDVPFEILLEWFQSGKYKEFLKRPFTKEELKGELGNTSWLVGYKKEVQGDGKEKEVEIRKSIREVCREKSQQAEDVIHGLKNAIEWGKLSGLDLENTRVGKIIYQEYFTVEKEDGTKGKNTIPIQNGMAFLGTLAMGYDTFALYDTQNKIYGVNSNHPGLEIVGNNIEEHIPGAQNVRGVWLIAPRTGNWMKNTKKSKFLELIDRKITKNANPISVLKPTRTPEDVKAKEVRSIDRKIDKLDENKDLAQKILEEELEKKKRIQEQLDAINAKLEKIKKEKEKEKGIRKIKDDIEAKLK